MRLHIDDIRRLKNSARIAQEIEDRWVSRVRTAIVDATNLNIEHLAHGGTSPIGPDFEGLLIRHYFETEIAALRLAEGERELDGPQRLAGFRSLKDIMRAYDLWRQGRYKPKRPATTAKGMLKRYLKAVQSTWKRYSEDWREGGETTKAEIKERIRRVAQTTAARAQTIVRMETTRYYNSARVQYYNAAEDVTHYLFMAIRDKATTPWCSAKTVNGKRGRHGLVYVKGDPLLKKEIPPCHWGCRSEFLPLNRHNPSHLRLINDRAIARRSHECTPLPPGWSAAS